MMRWGCRYQVGKGQGEYAQARVVRSQRPLALEDCEAQLAIRRHQGSAGLDLAARYGGVAQDYRTHQARISHIETFRTTRTTQDVHQVLIVARWNGLTRTQGQRTDIDQQNVVHRGTGFLRLDHLLGRRAANTRCHLCTTAINIIVVIFIMQYSGQNARTRDSGEHGALGGVLPLLDGHERRLGGGYAVAQRRVQNVRSYLPPTFVGQLQRLGLFLQLADDLSNGE